MYEIFEKLMQERGLNHYKVFRATGVSQSSLSDWKAGKGIPGAQNLAKLADYFGVSVDYLMGRKNAEKPAPKREDELSKDEIQLLAMYRAVPPEHRKLLYSMIEAALKSQGVL